MKKSIVFILFFTFLKLFSQNNVLPININTFYKTLEEQKAPYKMLMFWYPKCETIESQFNSVENLQRDFSRKLVILPISTVSTLKYKDDLHNLYYQKYNLGKSLEISKEIENPYENFETFKAKLIEKIGGKNPNSFYFLFDNKNILISEWENLPTKEQVNHLLK